MAIFNGTDYTLADFLAGDGFGYVEIWDEFWPDVLTEMSNRAAAVGAGLVAVSISSVTIGTGSKSFNVGTGKGFSAGMWLTAVDAGNSANSLTGSVTSYNSGTGTLVLTVPTGATTGSGTITAWTLGIGGKPGATGPAGPISTYWGGTAGGTANALTATTGASLTGLAAGQIIGVKIGASANSGAATLAIDSVSAIAIRKNGSALSGGELVSNADAWFQYDGTYLRLLGGSSGGALVSGYLSKTGAYTVVAADANKEINCSGTFTLSLTDAASLGASSSAPVSFLVYNSGTGTITISPLGSKQINGAANYALGPNQYALVTTEGTKWDAMGTGAVLSLSTWSTTDLYSGVFTLSNSNYTATRTTSSGSRAAIRATQSLPSGKFYNEYLLGGTIASEFGIGLMLASADISDGGNPGAFRTYGYGVGANAKITPGVFTTVTLALAAGDVVGFAWDFPNGYGWVRKNGVWQFGGDPITGANPTFTGLSTTANTYKAAAYIAVDAGQSITYRPRSSQWDYAAPVGFAQHP